MKIHFFTAPFLFWRFRRGAGKRIEDLRVAERGGTVFPKTQAKRDLLRPRTVCRKDEEAILYLRSQIYILL